MNTLQYDNTHITMKALTIFKNVIRHLEKKEASPIALALAGRLLPLFNDVSSEVRECSVLLFKDLMESVLWWKKGEMKKTVHRAIIPLLFRMHDNTESVAKASAEVLLACAKFLKWKQLEQLAQTEDISKIGGYLLKQKRSRVEGYLQQSLTYLEDDQTSLRKMAVKFIGFAVGSAGIRSEEKLNELIQALQLVVKDVDPSVCITAAHTILKLRSRIKTPIPLWDRLAECCCWPCIARANDSV
ncbi:maestro heat-like repeat-containing protein family member 7 [Anas acuta]|uniref:maestro heat-like repeat-containing protein family member 7 n=1 Tax=Anas acuta TaxID=28680 RepID=UPI0035C89C7D